MSLDDAIPQPGTFVGTDGLPLIVTERKAYAPPFGITIMYSEGDIVVGRRLTSRYNNYTDEEGRTAHLELTERIMPGGVSEFSYSSSGYSPAERVAFGWSSQEPEVSDMEHASTPWQRNTGKPLAEPNGSTDLGMHIARELEATGNPTARDNLWRAETPKRRVRGLLDLLR